MSVFVLASPVVVEGAQDLGSHLVREEASERAVLPQLTRELRTAGEDVDDAVEAAVEHVGPLFEVAHRHTVRALSGAPAGNVLPGVVERGFRIGQQDTEKRAMQPQGAFLLSGQGSPEESVDLAARDAAMGADDHVWQGAAIAQIHHVLSRDSEESRDISCGDQRPAHVPMIEGKHQRHNQGGVDVG